MASASGMEKSRVSLIETSSQQVRKAERKVSAKRRCVEAVVAPTGFEPVFQP
jgi:hypothetical protein